MDSAIEHDDNVKKLNENTSAKQDGKYTLTYTQEGVYLSLLQPQNGGKAIDTKEIILYIKRKNIVFADMAKITDLITAGYAENEKIATPQEEIILDEKIEIEFLNGKMEAYFELLKGEEGGKVLSKEEILYEIENDYKISFGINKSTLDDIIDNRRYYKKKLIAVGKHPVNGENGRIIFKFDCEISDKQKFQTKENGKVDFRTLNNVQNVEKGQVLVERVPAGEGEGGVDVCGKEIPARKGKEAIMPLGKNIELSEDKLILMAAINGRVDYIGNKVVVSQLYEVNGNLDMTVGNIDFSGDVFVKGKVNSGFSIVATGKITIGGLCEGAYIKSESDVMLKGGIQGAGKGKVIAGGSVYAKFIERATVEAEEKISADFIIQSKILSEGCVEVLNNKGAIIGGSISASSYFAGKIVGSDSGIATEISLGVSPKKREEYSTLKKRIEEIRGFMRRIDLSLNSSINSFSSVSDSQSRIDKTMKLMTLKKENDNIERRLEDLEFQINNTEEGTIHIIGDVFPGVKISIGSYNLTIKSEQKYVTFRINEGYIEGIPCRFRL